MGNGCLDSFWKKQKNIGKNRQGKDTLRPLLGNEAEGIFVDRFDHL
jgi:hypothetical protein